MLTVGIRLKSYSIMRYKRSGFFSYLSAFHLHNRKLLASEYTDCECFSHFIFLSLPLQFFSSFSCCPICAEGDSTLTISNTVKGTKHLPIDHQRFCLSDLNFFLALYLKVIPKLQNMPSMMSQGKKR